MYSKANFRSPKEIVIPENYRGNAFSEQTLNEELLEQTETKHLEVTTPENHVADLQQDEIQNSPQNSHQTSFLASLLPPRVSNPSGILNNIGLEEMLIVGILILLSQSGTDDDVLLLLFLLLFYK